MKEVAENLKVHLSTISRIVSNKYIQTPHGLFSMKFFFSTTAETAEGNSYAQPSIFAAVKEIIGNEDKNNPLKDSQIVKALIEKQFTVSRRTISKYRQTLNIPSYSQRKVLK
jgi:RNA polymerase sigma-54 factor